jgi:hypothetical protein
MRIKARATAAGIPRAHEQDRPPSVCSALSHLHRPNFRSAECCARSLARPAVQFLVNLFSPQLEELTCFSLLFHCSVTLADVPFSVFSQVILLPQRKPTNKHFSLLLDLLFGTLSHTRSLHAQQQSSARERIAAC